MKTAVNAKKILIWILAISAALTLFGLSRGDTVNDEVFMAFRGLGPMDFDEAEAQTTPWEWLDGQPRGIPWWAKISMHDHPLLVPLTQHFSMKAFGESNFGFRLPSALLGIASVYLIFLLGRRLFSENAGLLSAALFGATLNHIYISRVGMQEAYVIFFLLLASYLFLKSLQQDKYLPWVGAIIGLGALAKYNTLILVPIFLTYFLLFKRDYFFNKKFWLGILISIIIFSPVIVYNLMLYRTVGHFDFQFSHIFGQNPEVWKVMPGKDIGTIWDRLQQFVPRLIATNSWVFLLLVAAAIAGFFVALLKDFKATLLKYRYLLLVISYLLLLLSLIGPSYRFLTMLTPFFALSIGVLFHFLNSRYLKQFALFAITPILLFEIFYSWNNQIAYYPVGPTPWLSSKVRYENYNWGYNELSKWLDRELESKMPALTFDLQYRFLEKLRDKALKEGTDLALIPYPALFVYDGNFDKAAKLWGLNRLHIYHAWPVISLKTYYDYLLEKGFDFYDRSGFEEKYFIFQTNIAPSPEARQLMRKPPIGIKNPRGEEVFQIYRF